MISSSERHVYGFSDPRAIWGTADDEFLRGWHLRNAARIYDSSPHVESNLFEYAIAFQDPRVMDALYLWLKTKAAADQ